MVLVDKPYVFEGPDGPVGLLDMFDGSRQLIVQHIMWLGRGRGLLRAATAGVDEMADGLLRHLRSRDTNFVLVSRGPFADLQRIPGRTRLGIRLVLLASQRLQL